MPIPLAISEAFITFKILEVGLKPKGLAKLGNIVAKANVSQFSSARNICCENKFCLSGTKCFCLRSKIFLLSKLFFFKFSHQGSNVD